MAEADSLRELEEEVARAARKLVTLHSENRELSEKVSVLESQLEESHQTLAERDRLLKQMKADRKEIRTGMLRIQEKLTALEKPMKEASR